MSEVNLKCACGTVKEKLLLSVQKLVRGSLAVVIIAKYLLSFWDRKEKC
jgi:hypothetical protein